MACGTRLGIQGQRNEEEEEASIGLQRRTVVDGWTHVLTYLCSVALVALYLNVIFWYHPPSLITGAGPLQSQLVI
jgi:hypothetical protein